MRILARKHVVELTNLSRSTIDRGVAAGTFPPPIPLSARRVGWLESDIHQWLAGRREWTRAAA